jgi:hypothetical protein
MRRFKSARREVWRARSRETSTIDDTQMQDLKKGRWYFNLHTPKFPAGELRGPVVRQ